MIILCKKIKIKFIYIDIDCFDFKRAPLVNNKSSFSKENKLGTIYIRINCGSCVA